MNRSLIHTGSLGGRAGAGAIIYLGHHQPRAWLFQPDLQPSLEFTHIDNGGQKYRKEAHRRFKIALEQNSYEDAKRILLEFEKWLRGINESAADSLMEGFEDILTLHRLKVPGLLRKTLTCTNPIESMFSTVRDCEGNIKRYRNSAMSQRWLATVLLHCEKGFRRVKGYLGIAEVIATIEQIQEEKYLLQKAP